MVGKITKRFGVVALVTLMFVAGGCDGGKKAAQQKFADEMAERIRRLENGEYSAQEASDIRELQKAVDPALVEKQRAEEAREAREAAIIKQGVKEGVIEALRDR